MVAGYTLQREITKRSRLLIYPLPEDTGINCCCTNRLTYLFPEQLYVALRKMSMGSVVTITSGWQEEENVLLHSTPASLPGLVPALPLLQAASLPE